MGRTSGWSVTLKREHPSQPWGIRLTGGCDLQKPIFITRVATGSPAEGQLKAGDEVLQIGDYDARDIRHQDAQMLFKNATNLIKLVIYREGPTILPVRELSATEYSLPRAPSGLPEYQNDTIGPLIFNTALLADRSRSSSRASTHRQEVEEEITALSEQPYRTTPLVLPGAKVKKDFGPTESYLRHHPNPMFRQAPPHPLLPHDIAMKHKVADSVLQKIGEEAGHKQVAHKQFNSPIGLYSEQNIIDSINQQTGAGSTGTPSPVMMRPNPRISHKKTVVYDPAKSETYKALQDQEFGDNVQEVTAPAVPKVFSPVKKNPPTTAPATVLRSHSTPQPHPVPGPQGHMNSVGHSEEIQQSYSFKRLMHMVQSEGVY